MKEKIQPVAEAEPPKRSKFSTRLAKYLLLACGQILLFLFVLVAYIHRPRQLTSNSTLRCANHLLNESTTDAYWRRWSLGKFTTQSPSSWPSHPGSEPLDDWIQKEASFAWQKIFQQIGPPAGADEGLVIASPSTDDPDYFYTWTRE